jgi:hypothetical protein
MKATKWLIALAALFVFAGCEKSDEQKLKDAQKDAAKEVEGMKLPSAK